jgi:DHA2 family multidrug resistance protein
VARYLGGSIGISAATTMLARNAQIHQTYLVANVFPSSLQYQETLRTATETLAHQGTAPALAQPTAMGLIGQTAPSKRPCSRMSTFSGSSPLWR